MVENIELFLIIEQSIQMIWSVVRGGAKIFGWFDVINIVYVYLQKMTNTCVRLSK